MLCLPPPNASSPFASCPGPSPPDGLDAAMQARALRLFQMLSLSCCREQPRRVHQLQLFILFVVIIAARHRDKPGCSASPHAHHVASRVIESLSHSRLWAPLSSQPLRHRCWRPKQHPVSSWCLRLLFQTGRGLCGRRPRELTSLARYACTRLRVRCGPPCRPCPWASLQC